MYKDDAEKGPQLRSLPHICTEKRPTKMLRKSTFVRDSAKSLLDADSPLSQGNTPLSREGSQS